MTDNYPKPINQSKSRLVRLIQSFDTDNIIFESHIQYLFLKSAKVCNAFAYDYKSVCQDINNIRNKSFS